MIYELNDQNWIDAFSKDAKPVLTVPDGATVRIRTIDCYMNNLRAENDPRGEEYRDQKHHGDDVFFSDMVGFLSFHAGFV